MNDGDPITRESLERCGVRDNGDGTYTVHASPGAADDLLDVVWYPNGVAGNDEARLTLYLAGDHPKGVVKFAPGNTWGGLRRLCAALGVPVPVEHVREGTV